MTSIDIVGVVKPRYFKSVNVYSAADIVYIALYNKDVLCGAV